MPYASGETPKVGDYVKNQWEQPGISNNVGPVKSFFLFLHNFFAHLSIHSGRVVFLALL